ncbi:ABC-type phosphate/phosphonate transport system substrate-binding protein [Aliiruegeria haliotis]|uniref:ABC-type phosphate/phosphonate transport system substrate-binding protein n=1 Tax=Aliiruegeria haliotis TaxID=1280846 RepID=A0A2T0RRH6_9RHOB|nr:PhnD/SsuA/transferrin family substrate-binding protein [Aliiruegeria haliotis]PRY23742.1 ABC-type phosphate/phosphonate transport system substrate-binding protein [Aliiruegeria haliotis]
MIAALPMYDHPGVRAERDVVWACIRDQLRARGVDAPETLHRADDLWEQWRSPDLLLGQTCGLPFRLEFNRTQTLVGSIDYGLPDTPPGHYHSLFVVRRSDPRDRLEDFDGAVLAYNEAVSQSGWGNAITAPVRFTVGPMTGSHRDSTLAVARGDAEIAAIDAISYRLIRAHTDFADTLKVVGRSPSTPGMALITAFPDLVQTLRNAITEGIAAMPQNAREALGVRGLTVISAADYMSVPIPPSPEAYAAEMVPG